MNHIILQTKHTRMNVDSREGVEGERGRFNKLRMSHVKNQFE